MIKFRAWNGYREVMADYVSAIQNGDTQGTPSSVNVIVNRRNETWDVKNDHVELLRFTGLKDVNGKEVYEGDVIRILSINAVSDVEYMRDGSTPEFETDRRTVLTGENVLGEAAPNDIEVIGNVHNNPELLEV